jgi:glucan phosphoethanolaminetransferase (alkaline phosphatase superfamily)
MSHRAPTSSLTRRAQIAIAALVMLLMLPNLIWLSVAHGVVVWVNALVVPSALLLALFAIFGNRLWLLSLLMAPFAALAPIEAFYIYTYFHPSTPEVLATIFATNSNEVLEYFGNALAPLFVCVTVAFGLALLTSSWLRHSAFMWRHRSRTWFILIAIAVPLAAFIAAFGQSSGGVATRIGAGTKVLQILGESIVPGYPFGLLPRLLEYRNEWKTMYASVKTLGDFRFHATRTNPVDGHHVYVLVIGESSRRDHWQLFGYARPTNPELSGIRNLIPIPQMLTSWPESIAAIPLILTRKPPIDHGMAWKEASILRAMQEARFDTWWVSNQMSIGKYDSPVSIYAYEAQHVLFLNHASRESAGSYDEVLLQPLRDILQHEHGDLFVVLHMMGSHMSYDMRYPDSFKYFRPTFSDPDDDLPQGEHMRNSYDNTILYTDHVLTQIIKLLTASGEVSALWFESDHGESLPTPTCSNTGHGTGSIHEFEIPALFWYSDSYETQFPSRVATLRDNAEKRILSADTFESLIDMAGVSFPGHDEARSLFSPQWQYRPRMVVSIWQVDYDKAVTGTGCDILFPPKDSERAR